MGSLKAALVGAIGDGGTSGANKITSGEDDTMGDLKLGDSQNHSSPLRV